MIPDWIIFLITPLVLLWALGKDTFHAYRNTKHEKNEPYSSSRVTPQENSRWTHVDGGEDHPDMIDISNPENKE